MVKKKGRSRLGEEEEDQVVQATNSSAVIPPPPTHAREAHVRLLLIRHSAAHKVFELRMDKSWMRAARSSAEFSEGTSNFIKFAFRTPAKNNRILCPCKICVNSRWLGELRVYDHLIYDGFMAGYTTWVHHGESMRPSETTSGPSSQFEE